MKYIFKKYDYQIRIISIYTIALALVYGFLTGVILDKNPSFKGTWVVTFWGLFVSIAIVIIGVIVGIVYIKRKEAKDRVNLDSANNKNI